MHGNTNSICDINELGHTSEIQTGSFCYLLSSSNMSHKWWMVHVFVAESLTGQFCYGILFPIRLIWPLLAEEPHSHQATCCRTQLRMWRGRKGELWKRWAAANETSRGNERRTVGKMSHIIAANWTPFKMPLQTQEWSDPNVGSIFTKYFRVSGSGLWICDIKKGHFWEQSSTFSTSSEIVSSCMLVVSWTLIVAPCIQSIKTSDIYISCGADTYLQ